MISVTEDFTIFILQRYDSYWLWGQKCSCLLLGNQLWSATESFYRAYCKGVSCTVVSSERRNPLQWLWWRVCISELLENLKTQAGLLEKLKIFSCAGAGTFENSE